jgi:hypothetical protein
MGSYSKTVDPSILGDMQKSECSVIMFLFVNILLNISTLQTISGWKGTNPELVDRGNHPALHGSRDDMEICLITC